MGVIIQFIVAFLLSALGSILMIYASLAIGQLPPFSNNRVAAAVVAFILINIAVNIQMCIRDRAIPLPPSTMGMAMK